MIFSYNFFVYCLVLLIALAGIYLLKIMLQLKADASYLRPCFLHSLIFYVSWNV